MHLAGAIPFHNPILNHLVIKSTTCHHLCLKILSRSGKLSTLFSCSEFGESGDSGGSDNSGESIGSGESGNSGESGHSGESDDSCDSSGSGDSGEIGVSCVFVETGESGCLNNNV